MATSAYTHLIDTYTPRLPAARWKTAAPFVRDSVRKNAGGTFESTKLSLTYLAAYADWILLTGVTTLNGDVWRPDLIDAYTVFRSREVKGNVAERERKALRALAGLPPTVEARRVTTTAETEQPYSPAERTQISLWASFQPSESRRLNCAAIAALGLGCGLTSAEILQARAEDIEVLSDGNYGVRVTGRRHRLVPATSAWNGTLAELVEARLPDEYLLAPRAAARKNPTVVRVRISSVGDVVPVPQRLRNSWIVDHLNAGTPMSALLHAAGLDTLHTFIRLMKYTEPLEFDTALDALRLTGSELR